jgi:hypothetical protein
MPSGAAPNGAKSARVSSSGWRLGGEVSEVVRTPHVPVVDDRARREQQKKKERREPPPSAPDDGPAPPDPTHGKIDILARISRQSPTASADTGISTALHSVGLLVVLPRTPASPSRRAPCIYARLHRLATGPGEKSGLAAPPA